MKIKRCSCVAAILFASSFCAWPQGGKLKDGDRSYTPTRLEWIAVTLNAELHVTISKTNDYQMAFIPLAGTNTILIYVTYLPSVNREALNTAISTARKVISIESQTRGWSSWLKVEERIELARE